MQMRKEWEWICKSEIKTARGHDYNEHRKREKKIAKKRKERRSKHWCHSKWLVTQQGRQ